MSRLSIQNATKTFGSTTALDGISFDVKAGQIAAVLGPSGCGKSTLLSVIAGLESLDHGTIRWDGKDLAGAPIHQRGFGLMFQNYALFPHMNIFENIGFGLRMQKMSQDDIRRRVAETLELVGLPGFGGRQVDQLSGGEQQRVALARSLAPGPRLLMLDEPLGSLDRTLREGLLDDLGSILRQAGQTTLFVTHDQEEAFSLADQVVVMRAGKAVQSGAPGEIYLRPNSVFVAEFVGLTNILPGKVQAGIIHTAVGDFPLPDASDGEVSVLLRPDAARLDGTGGSRISGQVEAVTFRGGYTRITLLAGQTRLDFSFPSRADLPEVGAKVDWGIVRDGVQVLETV